MGTHHSTAEASGQDGDFIAACTRGKAFLALLLFISHILCRSKQVMLKGLGAVISTVRQYHSFTPFPTDQTRSGQDS